MGSPRTGGSASSGKHVDGGGDGRGSSSELFGTFDAREGDVDRGWECGGHWCSGWLVVVAGGGGQLAGFDGTPGGILGSSRGHPDSSSTTAESLGTGLLTSGWSPGTVGEGLLTSGTLCAWGWLLDVEELLDGLEIGETLHHLLFKSGSVGIVSGNLAGESSLVLGVLGGLEGSLGIDDSLGKGVELIVLGVP